MVLFKSKEKLIFLFSQVISLLVQAKVPTTLLWVVVPSLILFSKPFAVLLGSVSLPSRQYGNWEVIQLFTSQSLECCLGSDSHIGSSEVSPGIHKQLDGVAFLSSFLSAIFLVLPSSPGPPFLMIQPNNFGFSYPAPLCISCNGD